MEKSAQAVTALPDVAACADVPALQQVVKPPSDPDAAAKIDAIERQLADAKARLDSGQFRDALPVAEKARALADELRYAPLQAEALVVIGTVQQNLGDTKAAQAELIDAFAAGERGRSDGTRAAAAVELISVEGVLESQFELAKTWEEIARALLDRIGGDTRLRLRLLRVHANVLFTEGKVDEFLAAQKESVDQHEQLAGPNDLDTLAGVLNLGVAYYVHGDFADALAKFHSARDAFIKAMGPNYVHVGLIDADEAHLLVEQGHSAEAIPLAEEALKILLATRGPNHGDTIDAQKTYAAALLYSGDVRRAAAFFDDRQPAWSKAVDADDPLTGDIVDVGASIDRARGQPARAIDELQRVIATRRPDDPQLAALLTRVAQCDLDLKRPKDALAAAERAVQVGTERKLEPVKLADAKFELARVLVATGGDKARARTLATEALAVFDHAQMTRAAEAKAWLDANK